jgi:hypothetical protein
MSDRSQCPQCDVEYLEPGRPRDAVATVNELIAILDNQELGWGVTANGARVEKL